MYILNVNHSRYQWRYGKIPTITGAITCWGKGKRLLALLAKLESLKSLGAQLFREISNIGYENSKYMSESACNKIIHKTVVKI